MFTRFRFYYLLLCIVLISVLVYFLSFFLAEYNIGGDDSRLYLYHNIPWYNNVSLKTWFGYLGDYNPQFFYMPYHFLLAFIDFFVVEKYVKNIFIIITFLFGFVFTLLSIYEISRVFFSGKSVKRVDIYILGAVFYFFSPLLYFTVYYNYLSSFVYISFIPMFVYFYFITLRTYRFIYAIISIFCALIWGSSFGSLPLLSAFLIVFALLIFISFLHIDKSKYLKFTRFLIFFTFLIFMSQAYYILPFLGSQFYRNNITEYVLSSFGKNSAYSTVQSIASLSSVPDNLLNLPSRHIFSKVLYTDTLYSVSFFGFIYLYVLIYGGYLSIYRKNYINRKYYISILIIFIASLYFQTVNFGPLGIWFFAFLTEHIPGWVMFRNFFNKFTIPFVLVYSIFISINLIVISKHIKPLYFNILLSLFLLVTIIQGYPLISGKLNVVTHYKADTGIGEKNRTTNVTFPDYYMKMNEDLKGIANGSRILSFPLTYASWSLVEDQTDDDMYIGLSPVTVFTGLDDFNGKFAFDTANNSIPGIKSAFMDSVYSRDVETFKKIIELLSIKYIVVNEKIYSNEYKDVLYRYGWEEDSFQDITNLNEILSDDSFELIRSYGNEASLKLYVYKDSPDKLKHVNQLVSYENLSISDLLYSDMYNKNLGYVNSKNLPENLNNHVVYELKGIDSYPHAVDLPVWHRGWAWPDVNNDPRSIKYKLVQAKEISTLLLEQDDLKKKDLSIWYMAKRAQEYYKYRNNSSKKDFNKIFSDLLYEFNKEPEYSSELYELVKKYIAYSERSLELNPKIFESYNYEKYLEFKKKNINNCLYDYCIELPKISEKEEILLLSGKNKLSTKFFDSQKLTEISELTTVTEYTNIGLDYQTPNLLGEENKINNFDLSLTKVDIALLGDFLLDNYPVTTYLVKDINKNSDFLLKGKIESTFGSGLGIHILEAKRNKYSDRQYFDLIFSKYERITDSINLSEYFKTSKNFEYYLVIVYTKNKETVTAIKHNLLLKEVEYPKFVIKRQRFDIFTEEPCTPSYTTNRGEIYNIDNKCSNKGFIILNDSYNKGWKINTTKNPTIFSSVITYITNSYIKASHFKVNGYANGWYIDTNTDIEIHFSPRYLFYIGLFVSIITIFFCAAYIVFTVLKSKKFKNIYNGLYTRYFRR